ncbi:MAG: hypothetical protein QOD10_5247 [Mycobacterium sp.]|nr:hypothetical protein [Mycobacterium sp.]
MGTDVSVGKDGAVGTNGAVPLGTTESGMLGPTIGFTVGDVETPQPVGSSTAISAAPSAPALFAFIDSRLSPAGLQLTACGCVNTYVIIRHGDRFSDTY